MAPNIEKEELNVVETVSLTSKTVALNFVEDLEMKARTKLEQVEKKLAQHRRVSRL